MARLATILSFGDHADAVPQPEEDYTEEQHEADDAASDASDDSFEFAFARPLVESPEADALADDLFAHGRMVPAYPVFRRDASASASASATAPPSPDTYCAWTPRSAPGSPAREPAFPKSASTGEVARRFRIRDLMMGSSGAGRRSHSDGKEKFLFLQPTPKPKSKASAPSAASAAAAAPAQEKQPAKKPQTKQQGKKKGAAAAPVTEMDMATAHKLFYSKPGAASASERPSTTTKTSYLPYRPAIVGFFAAAHGLRTHASYIWTTYLKDLDNLLEGGGAGLWWGTGRELTTSATSGPVRSGGGTVALRQFSCRLACALGTITWRSGATKNLGYSSTYPISPHWFYSSFLIYTIMV